MTRRPHLFVLVSVACAASYAAASYADLQAQAAAPDLFEGVTFMYDTPAERCLSKGVGEFADLGQWPTTLGGRDARKVIEERCGADVWAFGPDAPNAAQR